MSLSLVISLILTTFVLEDAALLTATGLIATGELLWSHGFFACFLGISIGDLGLFAFGRLARETQSGTKLANYLGLNKALQPSDNHTSGRKNLSFDLAIFVSRAIPGSRTLTYISIGYFKYPPLRFLILTVLSVSLWVALALSVGQVIWKQIEQTTSSWVWAPLGLVVLILIVRNLLRNFSDKWQRLAWLNGFRKWQHFEFWPAWIFYLPIVPYVIFLAIRRRSWRAPFLVNPCIENGGWIGESKWNLLQKLNSSEFYSLKAFIVSKDTSVASLLDQMINAGLEFPVIFKPDVGQRGFGVRIIKDEEQAGEYMVQAKGPVIVQQLSSFSREAGIFYVRRPNEQEGFIFSITDKHFPAVVGDGVSSLGELILTDGRARAIAKTYFERFKNRLDEVPLANSQIPLVKCGNHCQGAVFTNGREFATEALRKEIDTIAKQIPGFYFGRFDVRYRSPHDLKQGKGFQIIEINGAGSEATHIWDRQTSLLTAYRKLFKQWALLFEVGSQIEKHNKYYSRISLRPVLSACLAALFRKGELSTSS